MVETLPARQRLETRNVCIDTSGYVAARFNFEGYSLARLTALAQAGDVRVFITSVIRREVESNIGEAGQAMATAVQQLKKKAAMLRDVQLPDVKAFFGEYDKDTVIRHLQSQFAEFLTSAKVTEVPMTGDDVEAVFEAYFGRRAPFGTGKKKAEFPDAFIVAALDRWCSVNDEQMYVITGDGIDQASGSVMKGNGSSGEDDEAKSMTMACRATRTLIPLSRLSAFLDLITLEEQTETIARARASAALQWCAANESRIRAEVSTLFLDLDFIPDDFEVEVENVDVATVVLTPAELIDIEDDSAFLTFRAHVDYTVDAFVTDPESGIWDSEDKVMLFQEKRKAAYSQHADVEGEVTLAIPSIGDLSADSTIEDIAALIELETMDLDTSSVTVAVDPESDEWDSDDWQYEAL